MKVSSTPRFSVCVTNSNSGRTIRRSLESALSLLQSVEFELIVVDNESTDNSKDYLTDLARKGIVKRLVVTRCTRGRGRQLAFENSSAPYILANIDMDVVYNDQLLNLIDSYHRRFEGKVLSVYGTMIMPRSVATELGGWRDLDRHEDSDLALRAFETGLHAQDFSVNVVGEHLKQRGGALRRWWESYINFRDWFRIGMKRRDLQHGEFSHPTVLLAWIFYRLHETYSNPKFSEWYRIWRSGRIYGEAS